MILPNNPFFCSMLPRRHQHGAKCLDVTNADTLRLRSLPFSKLREAFVDSDVASHQHEYDVHRSDLAPHQRTPIPARLTGILCYNMFNWFLYCIDVASQGLTCNRCDVTAL